MPARRSAIAVKTATVLPEASTLARRESMPTARIVVTERRGVLVGRSPRAASEGMNGMNEHCRTTTRIEANGGRAVARPAPW
jgi:hypothetical protein